MVLPGVTAVLAPVFVGKVLGVEAPGGLLAGATVMGVLMALFMANAGGAWDNAKKYIEGGAYGGKGSDLIRPLSSVINADPVHDYLGAVTQHSNQADECRIACSCSVVYCLIRRDQSIKERRGKAAEDRERVVSRIDTRLKNIQRTCGS